MEGLHFNTLLAIKFKTIFLYTQEYLKIEPNDELWCH
jgi:hypothetical protein